MDTCLFDRSSIVGYRSGADREAGTRPGNATYYYLAIPRKPGKLFHELN